jgi:sirohydrochlorin ferrochelatase
MKRTLSFVALLAVTALVAVPATPAVEKASGAKPGILLLAHGGSRQSWNDEVEKIAARVERTVPVEVAFGMASKKAIQPAIDRLVARGVSEIVAVPLFISSHSTVITSTEYLLGLRADAPPELAIFAKMDHSHGGHGDHHAHAATDPSFDPTTPVKSAVPIRMTAAINRHEIAADILFDRATALSREPAREVVVVVAHGPVSDEENAKWLADMGALVERMRARSSFRRIEYLTVRDDAPDPIRSQATAELRAVVGRAASEGNRVLVVPHLIAFGGIEAGIRKRLEGLSYEMSPQGLLPDDRLVRWVLVSAGHQATTASSTR